MPSGGQQLLGQGAGGHAGGRFPRAGPLQDGADRTEVLHRSAQVAMARPGAGQVVHAVDLEVLVGDDQGDGAAQGDAAPDAAEDLDVVGFEALAAAASIAALPAAEFGVDQLGPELHARRKPVHQGHQRLAVRFACGQIA